MESKTDTGQVIIEIILFVSIFLLLISQLFIKEKAYNKMHKHVNEYEHKKLNL